MIMIIIKQKTQLAIGNFEDMFISSFNLIVGLADTITQTVKDAIQATKPVPSHQAPLPNQSAEIKVSLTYSGEVILFVDHALFVYIHYIYIIYIIHILHVCCPFICPK